MFFTVLGHGYKVVLHGPLALLIGNNFEPFRIRGEGNKILDQFDRVVRGRIVDDNSPIVVVLLAHDGFEHELVAVVFLIVVVEYHHTEGQFLPGPGELILVLEVEFLLPDQVLLGEGGLQI